MPSIRELGGWLTTGQAAHIMGYSRQGVIDLAREGRVRAVYVGGDHSHGRGAWIYDPESVEAYARRVAAERESNVQAASRPPRKSGGKGSKDV